jgi:hypothetical protein
VRTRTGFMARTRTLIFQQNWNLLRGKNQNRFIVTEPGPAS